MIEVLSLRWRRFGAGEAEKITGMSGALQRNKRLRGQLTALPEGVLKARLSAVLLGEMVFVGEAAKLGIGTIDNLTVRAVGAQWVAYWALLNPKGCPGVEDRENVARKLLQLRADKVPPIFAVLPVEAGSTWKNVQWSNDPAAVLRSKRLAVAINLKRLGEDMAAKAGALVEAARAS